MMASLASGSTGKPAGGEVRLDCFVYPGWAPRIRAAPPQRDWMDASPERFAYRCLPLDIANAHGWELLSPCGFEAEWNGGSAVEDVTVRADPGTPSHMVPVALFGQGVLTFHVEGLFRTSEGFNLCIGGSPNSAKDGLSPLSGIIETDWSPYSFTMNWRFTRANHPIRFEENEPFCFFFPIERQLVERVVPRVVPIEDDPALAHQFGLWSASRDAFQHAVQERPPTTASEKWQKFYFRGVCADGSPGVADHRSKLRLAEFEGTGQFQRQARPAPACPSAHRGSVPATQASGASLAKLEWILDALQRLRRLAPLAIPRRAQIAPEEFLRAHYGANHPLVLENLLAGWRALNLWTPDYLKRTIGTVPVEIQAGRGADPDFERAMEAHRTTMPFNEFIDRISPPATTNDLYMTAFNSAANTAALSALLPDLSPLDGLPDVLAGHSQGMMWIGPAGTFTPLHHDLTNNLLLQIIGRKRVLMVAPADTPKLYNDHHVYSRVRDLAEPGIVSRFPMLDGVQVHQIMLKPGDALFLPLGWWHQVSALDFSISITHTNFRWPNDFHANHPAP
jgi:hypothetical protein